MKITHSKNEAEKVMVEVNSRVKEGKCFKDLIQINSDTNFEKATTKVTDSSFTETFNELMESLKQPQSIKLQRKGNSPNVSQYFDTCTETGLGIGYHVEEVEDPNQPLLTIEDLDPNKPFFICNNRDDWFPYHLGEEVKEGKFRLYKVMFEISNYLVFIEKKPIDHFKSIYFELFETVGKVRLNKKTKWLTDNCKVNLFILNNKTELFEGFLVNSNKVVKELRKV